MTSKLDYPDPGQDPEYCNGLTPKPEILYDCAWCEMPCEDGEFAPFCGPTCQKEEAEKR
jgi:hypothetical protein